jgi:hypothetical protein
MRRWHIFTARLGFSFGFCLFLRGNALVQHLQEVRLEFLLVLVTAKRDRASSQGMRTK